MKVALVQPLIGDNNFIPSLGLLYIASLLEKDNFDVKLFDENILGEQLILKIKNFKPDIVGITVITSAVNKALQISTKIKEININTIICMGGAHVTAVPLEVIGSKNVDFAFVNESEYPMLEFCRTIRDNTKNFNNIKNILYKADNKIIENEKADFLEGQDLDKLPFPSFHLLDLKFIYNNNLMTHGLFSKGRRILPIITTRGCPQQCTFCCRIMGYKYRMRSPENVIEEIKYLIEHFHIDELYIEDDNFTANKQRAIKILDMIIEKKFNIYIKFANGLRIDTLDEEILIKMKQAGCYYIGFGLESASMRVLKMMKKNLDLEKVKNNIELAKKHKFLVGANCIIGYPGENKEDIKETVRFLKKLKIDSTAMVNLVPFPNTQVRKLCEEKQYLTKEAYNYDNYYFNIGNPIVLVETEFLKSEELKKIAKNSLLSFYLTPKNIFNIFRFLSFKKIILAIQKLVEK